MANPTLAEVERVVASVGAAEDVAEYGESIKCTATAIQGDRYKIIFSEHSTEGDKYNG